MLSGLELGAVPRSTAEGEGTHAASNVANATNCPQTATERIRDMPGTRACEPVARAMGCSRVSVGEDVGG
jgi:hypothetical protein